MMKKITIFTDSASDFTTEQLQMNNVKLIPMTLLCGNDTYTDDKTISMKLLWDRMKKGEILTTSQPSPYAFQEAFEKAKQNKEAVICILLSSALSGTYQSAVLAKSLTEYDDIYIVDSRCAAAAEKLLVLKGVELRDKGELSAAEIAAELETFRSRIRLFACINTLEYLVRGGRLSKLAGNIGSLLNIKPIFTFSQDGNINILKKVPGNKRAMAEMVNLIKTKPFDKNHPLLPIFACEDIYCKDFLKYFKEQTGAVISAKPEEIGATIGCHIGPGGFGIVYVEQSS